LISEFCSIFLFFGRITYQHTYILENFIFQIFCFRTIL
jgi:hypothetical protein